MADITTALRPVQGAEERAGRARKAMPEWFEQSARFERPHLGRALGQVADSVLPYLALWAVMVASVRRGLPYWVILALAVPASGLLVRIFILFHDCAHGSFFASRRANTLLGTVAGILTFTPFQDWRRDHNLHHATAGDLDRRGWGDVTTLTVEEYRTAPRWKRLSYRAYRNPFVMFLLGPFYLFVVKFRFFSPGTAFPERASVLVTDLGIIALTALAGATVGFKTYLSVQLPVILLSGTWGVWLFYVQHQFERAYWARHEAWDPVKASMQGSSHYKLPRVLQWFSGNIGLHHIHHVRPRIPNYNLQRCYDEVPALQSVEPLTFLRSLRSLRLHLWDERNRRMVGFRALREPGRDAA